ncbi:MAG: hypothetical protein CBE00_01285 [Planctomycetaceae bacterium TMED240]|nr:MAG: hypothetical protein CBE00_01285 [Planctomycetaceae bacterium TMED240]
MAESYTLANLIPKSRLSVAKISVTNIASAATRQESDVKVPKCLKDERKIAENNVNSGAAPPPVPPRRKVIKASMGNRGQVHLVFLDAKRVPVTLILMIFARQSIPNRTLFPCGGTKLVAQWLSLHPWFCPLS